MLADFYYDIMRPNPGHALFQGQRGATIGTDMQTLGLSDSAPRTESRWQALFWPTIRNEADFDYITCQGFWICTVVAAITFVLNALASSPIMGTFEGLFFFLAGIGVRERDRAAAMAAFSAYLLSAMVMQRYTGSGFGIVPIIFLALLFATIRGSWLAAGWEQNLEDAAPVRLNQTFGDKIADQLPKFLWPKARYVFYVLAWLEISLLLVSLLTPRGTATPNTL